MTAQPGTAGQAAREAFGELGADWYPGVAWDDLHPGLRAQWESAAQAAIAAARVPQVVITFDGEVTQERAEEIRAAIAEAMKPHPLDKWKPGTLAADNAKLRGQLAAVRELADGYSAATEDDKVDGYTPRSLYMAIRAEVLNGAAVRLHEILDDL